MLTEQRAQELHQKALELDQPFSRAKFGLAAIGVDRGRALCGIGTTLAKLEKLGLVTKLGQDKYVANALEEEHEPLQPNPMQQQGWPPPPPFPIVHACFHAGRYWAKRFDGHPFVHDGREWRPA